MKTFLAFALLVVGISALPPQTKLSGINFNNERLVTDSIASAIEDVSQSIKDAGLDPFYIESESVSYALPVSVLFNAQGVMEEMLFRGVSEIVINSMSYSLLTSRLRFDISLPLIEATLKNANMDVEFFGNKINANVAGRFAIENIRMVANIRLNIGIITGISVRSIVMNFSIDEIYSNLSVVIGGLDMSSDINNFLSDTVPTTLKDFESEINELIEIVATQVINDNV